MTAPDRLRARLEAALAAVRRVRQEVADGRPVALREFDVLAAAVEGAARVLEAPAAIPAPPAVAIR